jgi:uncharacterized protein involved in cysteine biosynthesis
MRWPVLAIGGVLAALALLPFVNLAVPVLGTAAMTHLFHRAGATRAAVRPRAVSRGA